MDREVNKDSYYYKTIKFEGRDAYRERVEREKMEKLERRAQNHTLVVQSYFTGELKQKFVSQIKRQGYKEADLVREMAKFYYDNNPNANKY